MNRLQKLLLCTVICLVVAIPGAVLFYFFGAEILRFIGESMFRGVSVTLGMAVAGTLFTFFIGWTVYKFNNRFR